MIFYLLSYLRFVVIMKWGKVDLIEPIFFGGYSQYLRWLMPNVITKLWLKIEAKYKFTMLGRHYLFFARKYGILVADGPPCNWASSNCSISLSDRLDCWWPDDDDCNIELPTPVTSTLPTDRDLDSSAVLSEKIKEHLLELIQINKLRVNYLRVGFCLGIFYRNSAVYCFDAFLDHHKMNPVKWMSTIRQ